MFTELAAYQWPLPTKGTIFNATEFVVRQRASIDANQGLCSTANVVRGQVRAVGKLDVDQAINRNCRISGKLDKAVEGEGEAVVQLVREILQKTRIIDCNVQREVRRVDEIRVLSAMCLGS